MENVKLKIIIKILIAAIPFIPLKLKSRFLRSGFFPLEKFTWIIVGLVVLFKPRVVVELGTGEGNESFVVGMALRKNKLGKLYSFDSYSERINNFEKKADDLVKFKAQMIGVSRYVEFIKCDVFKYTWEGEKIDMLIIDIDNNYERLRRLCKAWFPHVKKNGFILIEGGYSKHGNCSRGIYKFCIYLNAQGYQTTLLPVYPGLVIARINSAVDY